MGGGGRGVEDFGGCWGAAVMDGWGCLLVFCLVQFVCDTLEIVRGSDAMAFD